MRMSWHVGSQNCGRLSVFIADDVLKRCISGDPFYWVSMALHSRALSVMRSCRHWHSISFPFYEYMTAF